MHTERVSKPPGLSAMESAVAELRHDYTRRAECGDGHAVFHLAVADWIEGHARDLAASGNLGSCDSPGDVEAAMDVATAWLTGRRIAQ